MYLEDQISECHGGSSVSLRSFDVFNQIVHLIKTPIVHDCLVLVSSGNGFRRGFEIDLT